MVQAAEKAVGRDPVRSDVPLLDPLREKSKEERDILVKSWEDIRRQEDQEVRRQMRTYHTNVK